MNPLAEPLVDLLHRHRRELTAAMDQRDAWRLIALRALKHIADLNQELEMVSHKRHTFRKYVNEVETSIHAQYDAETAA